MKPMLKSDLQPPLVGPSQNPVLYGVANGLARLFPPVEPPHPAPRTAAAKRPSADRTPVERS